MCGSNLQNKKKIRLNNNHFSYKNTASPCISNLRQTHYEGSYNKFYAHSLKSQNTLFKVQSVNTKFRKIIYKRDYKNFGLNLRYTGYQHC